MANKIKDSVFGVFWHGLKLYLKNFIGFCKYMLFPVFGQLLGIILILAASYFYASILNKLIVPGGLFDNFTMIFLVLILLLLPGFIVLIKAFWDYLVAYGAVNSMLDSMLKSGKLYDFHAHTEVITRRSASYGLLWVLLAILGFFAITPLFWVIAAILAVYFVLIFQVFTYEPDKNVFGCFKKSLEIIKGNFWRTVGLMLILGVVTYIALPELLKFLFELAKITNILIIPFDAWASQLPIKAINQLLLQLPLISYQITSVMVAKFVISFFLGYIITSLTLPLRVICWGLWYKNLNKNEPRIDKQLEKRIKEQQYGM